jgi:hypothetical protein
VRDPAHLLHEINARSKYGSLPRWFDVVSAAERVFGKRLFRRPVKPSKHL